jgi:hypothetical protein
MAQQVSASEYVKRKAAREAHEAAIAQAEAALKEVAEEYTATFASLVEHLRAAASDITKAQAQMRTMGQLALPLSTDGRAPVGTNPTQLQSDLAQLISAAFAAVPGHRHRLGSLTWPSSELRWPAGGDWAAKEAQRVHDQIVAPLTSVEG